MGRKYGVSPKFPYVATADGDTAFSSLFFMDGNYQPKAGIIWVYTINVTHLHFA